MTEFYASNAQQPAFPSQQTSSSYSTKNNYQSAYNIDLISKFKRNLPICPLTSKLSNRDGSAGNLNNFIHSSSGNGACPAACLVTFSAFYLNMTGSDVPSLPAKLRF
jgi:hypothetical protein